MAIEPRWRLRVARYRGRYQLVVTNKTHLLACHKKAAEMARCHAKDELLHGNHAGAGRASGFDVRDARVW